MKEYKARFAEGNKTFPPTIFVEINGLRIHHPGIFNNKNKFTKFLESTYSIGKITSEDEIVLYCNISNVNIKTPLIGYSTISFNGKNGLFYEFHGLLAKEVNEIEHLIELGKAGKIDDFYYGTDDEDEEEEEEDEEEDEDEEEEDEEENEDEEEEDEDDNEEDEDKNEGKDDDIKESEKKVRTIQEVKQSPIGPPPPPIFSYYAMIDNKQHGPYDSVQFKRLIDNDLVNAKTFVWTE